MSEKDALRRFCAAVFRNEILFEALRAAAADVKPGCPCRIGLLTRDQRTWCQNLLRRKLWKAAPFLEQITFTLSMISIFPHGIYR